MSAKFKTLWISDVHLGSPSARSADLLQFLADVSADQIYLVGDIVDLVRIKARPRFPDIDRQVVSRLLQLAHSGTDVSFIPGNHDFEFRDLVGRDLCGVRVLMEAEHQMPDGRRLLVIHGDSLDGEVRRGTNLEQFGAAAYHLLSHLDVTVNQLRHRFGRDYLSIIRPIKERLAGANEYIGRFERVAAAHARQRGFDGIVCGHIHRPCLRQIDGVLYANDGDWVEHRSALAESRDGQLSILTWARDGLEELPRAALESLAA